MLAAAAGLDMASVGALVLGLDVLQTGQAQPWLVGLSIGLFLMAASLIVSAARALREVVAASPAVLDSLEPEECALIRGRILESRSWDDVAAAAGLSDARVAMRALRRAMRAFIAARSSLGDQSAT